MATHDYPLMIADSVVFVDNKNKKSKTILFFGKMFFVKKENPQLHTTESYPNYTPVKLEWTQSELKFSDFLFFHKSQTWAQRRATRVFTQKYLLL